MGELVSVRSDAALERWGLLAGFLYVAVSVARIVWLTPSAAPVTAGSAALETYYGTRSTVLVAASVLTLVLIMCEMVMFISIKRMLERQGEVYLAGVFFGVWLLTAGLAAMRHVLILVPVTSAPSRTSEIVGFAVATSGAMRSFEWLLIAVLTATLALALHRRRLAGWYVTASSVMAVAAALGGLALAPANRVLLADGRLPARTSLDLPDVDRADRHRLSAPPPRATAHGVS